MRTLRRRLSIVSIVSVGALGTAAPALAGDPCYPPPPPGQCNAGNGNGSDVVTFIEGEHCYGGDPGNSYNAGNKGGDEIPTSGGVPNPGGNNVP
jgi:hypothetical protein